MASSWGEQFVITLFGESHGPGLGVVIDGLPAGEAVDEKRLETFLQRRAPGRAPWSTARREADVFQIISGVYQGKTTGTPLCAVVKNEDARSKDYLAQQHVPRPSHADYTGHVRYQGAHDPRGGGHFSGRLTAPLCFAGALSLQMLERRGISIYARISELGGIPDSPLDLAQPNLAQLGELAGKDFPVLDTDKGKEMIHAVEQVHEAEDSLGGVVQCFALGVSAGLGDPIFGGIESRLASLLYAIPAVKGVSFGAGFTVCRRRGSENNDSFYLDGQGQVRTRTNHDGGINGGITNGMPLVVNVGIKPTPSISAPQTSVNLKNMQTETLKIRGRHDPCIVPRALVAVEAAMAIALIDRMLVAYGLQGFSRWEQRR